MKSRDKGGKYLAFLLYQCAVNVFGGLPARRDGLDDQGRAHDGITGGEHVGNRALVLFVDSYISPGIVIHA